MLFSSLKETISSLKTSDKVFNRAFYIGSILIWKLSITPYRLVFNSEYRSLQWLKYFKNGGAHQISNFTMRDRYPNLFSNAQKIMQGRKELKILSYGCSTGEEVFTLREYFPDAAIVGIDINKSNIKKANRTNNDRNILFSHTIEKTLFEEGPFDLIFALAVLQRTENRNPDTYDSTPYYPFEKFNAKLTELDPHLRPEGIFVIDHADYLFEESDIFSQYRPSDGEEKIIRNRPKFNKHNQRITEQFPHNRIFIKQQGI